MAPLSRPAYRERLERELGHERAMQAAIGRHVDEVGAILRAFLAQNGLLPSRFLVDVGCGAGRLAKPLRDDRTGPYLGVDVVPAQVEHARRIVRHPDWRLETVHDIVMPERDGRADFAVPVPCSPASPPRKRIAARAGRFASRNRAVVVALPGFALARHRTFFETGLDPVSQEAARGRRRDARPALAIPLNAA